MRTLICIGCKKEPQDIPEYQQQAEMEASTPKDVVEDYEGTYSSRHELFCCTNCYVDLGLPLNPELNQRYRKYRQEQGN